MELTIKRSRKEIPLWSFLACPFLLIPSIILASAITQPLIGMVGVDNSQLTLGMDAIDDSTRLFDFILNPAIVSPSSPAGAVAIIIPLVFLATAILLILNMISNRKPDIKSIVIIAVLIYLTLAFLPNIQAQVTNILGG